MRRNKKFSALITVLIVAFSTGVSFSANTVTIEGIVNDFYQVITDDVVVYDISDDEKGNQLAQYIGKRVIVTGELEVDEGVLETRTIFVSKFRVIPDKEEFVEEDEEHDDSLDEDIEPDISEEDEDPDESFEEDDDE